MFNIAKLFTILDVLAYAMNELVSKKSSLMQGSSLSRHISYLKVWLYHAEIWWAYSNEFSMHG